MKNERQEIEDQIKEIKEWFETMTYDDTDNFEYLYERIQTLKGLKIKDINLIWEMESALRAFPLPKE